MPSQDCDRPEFSAIITCYFEEKTIEEYHSRLSAAFESLGRTYEIILVNDGSTDGTFDKLRTIFNRDPNVITIMDLIKNSGQRAAMTAGICSARGKIFLFMDSDLQLDPAELPLLVAEYDKGFDIVSGCRRNRTDSWSRIIPSKLANMIMRKVSKTNLTDFGCTFKLYNSAIIRALELGPNNLFNPPLAIAQAQRCAEVPVTHFPRKHGKSGWTFRKLWEFNMDNIVRLSERPFQFLAMACLTLAVLFVLRIGVDYLSPFKILSSITPGLLLNVTVISLLIIVGILCMIGEFTIRIFKMSSQVPLYIVRERLERTRADQSPRTLDVQAD